MNYPGICDLKINHLLVLILGLLLQLGCGGGATREVGSGDELTIETPSQRPRAKFEPEDGKCILMVGQELVAIGGLDDYNDGYLDHFDAPGGFVMYTNFSPGDSTFGSLKGNDGVVTTDNWGDGNSNMSLQIADPDFENMVLAIGLAFVGHDEAVANGDRDDLVIWLGEWIKSLGRRPVFLRIGYEFSGSWNHYDQENYIKAYRRIKDKYDSLGVENVAYVWQSHGWEEPMDLLEAWYPGDDYVDWCAYSHFSRYTEQNMIEFARKKGKPVFIAEATPAIASPTVKSDGKTKETILSNPEQAEEAWYKWFVPFFKTIHDNPDVVKAFNYINCHWKANPMWYENKSFQDIDARLQVNPDIAERWNEEMAKPTFLKSSPELWDMLWNE